MSPSFRKPTTSSVRQPSSLRRLQRHRPVEVSPGPRRTYGFPARRSPTCSRSPPAPPHRLGQARGELADPLRGRGERASPPHRPALPDRHLREVTMNIQPDPPPGCRHRRPPFHGPATDRERVGEATPTDPRAQRNLAGRRGGHLLTRALSPSCNTGLPTLLHSRRRCPGRSHRMPATHPPGSGRHRRNRRRLRSSYRLPTRSSRPSPRSGTAPRSLKDRARGQLGWRWRSSSSSQHKTAGARSTRPTSSPWSTPERPSSTANSLNDPARRPSPKTPKRS
jgi:hypothetical protein